MTREEEKIIETFKWLDKENIPYVTYEVDSIDYTHVIIIDIEKLSEWRKISKSILSFELSQKFESIGSTEILFTTWI